MNLRNRLLSMFGFIMCERCGKIVGFGLGLFYFYACILCAKCEEEAEGKNK